MKTVSELATEQEGHFAIVPAIHHFFSNKVYAKQIDILCGTYVISHKHTYDHMSILAQGRVIVRTDTTRQVYRAPAVIDIKAGTNHEITALEDSVWFCIHSTEETDVDHIDETLIGE